MSELKNKVVKGAAWVMLEKLFGQMATFVVTMVLSRILTPDDYGTVALLTIFFTISSLVISCGLGGALVQRKEATALHFNSLFYASLVMSIVVYAILFAIAPWVARFYQVPDLKIMLRLSALTLVFNAVSSVQGAELCRNLAFYLNFRITVMTTIASAATGISLALLGYGPWAIVCQGVVSSFVGVVAKWFIIAWRPQLIFSFKALGELFEFGWKTTAVYMIAYVTRDFYGLIIGKYYSPADLAYVNKGRSLPNMVMQSITGTILGVSFPALAKLQDSRDKIREGMNRMLQCTTFLVFPLMTGLAVCTPDVMRLLFGSQWGPAVTFMQIVCFQCALTPVADVNMQGIVATGKTKYFIPMQVIKTGTSFVVLIISLYFGVFYFVLLQCIFCKFFEIAVNSWPNRKEFDFPMERQIMILLPTAICCAIMAAVVYGVHRLLLAVGISGDAIWQLLVRVAVQFVVGVVVYFVAAYLLRINAFREYLVILSNSKFGKNRFVSRILGRLLCVYK